MIHKRSCMLDSLLILIDDAEAWRALATIGHNGEDRGFHSQELLDVADSMGYTLVEVQRWPSGINPETYETVKITPVGGCDGRFVRYLMDSRGILMGLKNGRSHAVAYERGVAKDPATGIHFRVLDTNDQLIEEYFKPHIFLRLENLNG